MKTKEREHTGSLKKEKATIEEGATFNNNTSTHSYTPKLPLFAI